tara:strand:- start:246 stop:410 length:165 start_codon:yes stop_codon:yes gene_type:complete
MKETVIVYIMFLVSALLISNCGVFPEKEVYVVNEKINDNVTEQQQINYWRTYAN